MSRAPKSPSGPGRSPDVQISPQVGALALAPCSALGFIALLGQVADIEHMIVEGLSDKMPCKKKHIYREQAFRQAVSLATTYFKTNDVVKRLPNGNWDKGHWIAGNEPNIQVSNAPQSVPPTL